MVGVERWIETDSHWQHLKPKFNPVVTRVFIAWFALAPVAIKALSSVPPTVLLWKTIPITLALPFSWAVLWWSSFFYAVSFLLYVSSCPRFIKSYPDYRSYENLNHSPRWLVWQFYFAWEALPTTEKSKLLRHATEKQFVSTHEPTTPTKKPQVLLEGTKYVFEHEGVTYQICLGTKEDADKLRDLFWELFGRWSEAATFRRMTAWFSFYVAITLAGWVVIQNVWFVLGYFLPFI